MNQSTFLKLDPNAAWAAFENVQAQSDHCDELTAQVADLQKSNADLSAALDKVSAQATVLTEDNKDLQEKLAATKVSDKQTFDAFISKAGEIARADTTDSGKLAGLLELFANSPAEDATP